MRLPRREGEDFPLFTGGRGSLASINRGSYWQLALAVAHGTAATVHEGGLGALRSRIAALRPELTDRLDALTDWHDVHELVVRVDHLRRWHRHGLLCIGDAAHAMSPAGGVGINLAVQDAVATANILGPVLRERTPTSRDLERVRRRRAPPTRLTQMFQTRVLRSLYVDAGDAPAVLPVGLRAIRRIPALRHVAGRFIGLGARPEHIGTLGRAGPRRRLTPAARRRAPPRR